MLLEKKGKKLTKEQNEAFIKQFKTGVINQLSKKIL